MRFKGLRWKAAAVIAFLMGVPFVEQAHAQDVGGIIYSAISLAFGIVDMAGNS
jgi:hypothetical protein